MSIGACAPDRAVTGSVYPYDHHARHPIVLADAPRNLDVFIVGSGVLNPRQREDVLAFAAEYRRFGQGPMAAQMPSGGKTDAYAHRTLDSIRATMAEAGVPGGVLSVSGYAVADPSVASTIRLSFRRLQAKVASKCGQWPQDLGGSDPRFNYGNEPYWNLGCATRRTLPPRSPTRSISRAAGSRRMATRCGRSRTSRTFATARSRPPFTGRMTRTASTGRSGTEWQDRGPGPCLTSTMPKIA
jgi:pilus biogenesis lipoprotein CpaD